MQQTEIAEEEEETETEIDVETKTKPEIVPLDDIVGREVRNDGEVDELEFEEASVEDERRKELALPARPTMLRRVIVVDESLQETESYLTFV